MKNAKLLLMGLDNADAHEYLNQTDLGLNIREWRELHEFINRVCKTF